MLHLRVFADTATITSVAERLSALEGARHVLCTHDGPLSLVTTDLHADAADSALQLVRDLGLAPEDIELLRIDSIGPAVAARPLAAVVWSDLLSQAGQNSRPLGRYLVLMATAGIIAGFGVIEASTILIVGA